MTWKTFDELETEIKAAFPGYRVRMHEDADGDTVEVIVGKYPSVSTNAKCSKELIYETVVNRVLEFERAEVLLSKSKNPVFI